MPTPQLIAATLILISMGCAQTSAGGSVGTAEIPIDEVVTKSLRIVDEEGRTRIQLYTEEYGAYARFQDTAGAPLIQVGINDDAPGPLAVVYLHDQKQGMVQLSLDREGSVAVELLQNGGRVTLEVDAEGQTTIQEQAKRSMYNVKSPAQTEDAEGNEGGSAQERVLRDYMQNARVLEQANNFELAADIYREVIARIDDKNNELRLKAEQGLARISNQDAEGSAGIQALWNDGAARIPVRIIGPENFSGARIYLSAKELGHVPWEGQLPAGKHALQVVGNEFFTKVQVTVPSEPEESPFIIDLAPR